MKVERALVIDFTDPVPKSEFNLRLAAGSIPLDQFVTLPDGVYALYLAPELITEESEITTYVVAGPNQSIDPKKHKFAQCVSLFSPAVDEKGNDIPGMAPNTIMFPLFRVVNLSVVH